MTIGDAGLERYFAKRERKKLHGAWRENHADAWGVSGGTGLLRGFSAGRIDLRIVFSDTSGFRCGVKIAQRNCPSRVREHLKNPTSLI